MNKKADVGKSFLQHHGVKGMKWGVRRSRRQLARAAEKQSKKSVKDLDDNELRAIVNRLNMEQQYSRLTSSPARNTKVKTLLAAGGTVNAAIAFSRSPAGKAVREALSKSIDTSAAVSSIGR